jgi:hypothetical protein
MTDTLRFTDAITRPRHCFYTLTYIDGKTHPVPYTTVEVLKTELSVGDIVVLSKGWETEDVDLLHRVNRINAKSITLLNCDQYGATEPYKGEYSKELYKCNDTRKFKKMVLKPIAVEIVEEEKKPVRTPEIEDALKRYKAGRMLHNMFMDGLTTDESGESRKQKGITDFYALMNDLYKLNASEASPYFVQWNKEMKTSN